WAPRGRLELVAACLVASTTVVTLSADAAQPVKGPAAHVRSLALRFVLDAETARTYRKLGAHRRCRRVPTWSRPRSARVSARATREERTAREQPQECACGHARRVRPELDAASELLRGLVRGCGRACRGLTVAAFRHETAVWLVAFAVGHAFG